MQHLVKRAESQIDLNKIRYDLALIYAKEKFAHALHLNQIPNESPDLPHPARLDEANYLMDQFEFALNCYLNTNDESLMKNLDFTYESDS